ncbi:hypothetical protein [Vibrio gigantis]|uniref:hypothetical protein n=1 Tax=Vibrio gigantis TaxID=296199 RepID=UPI001BFDDAC5|nr:hypothetical protein [Vibrio gigantis]
MNIKKEFIIFTILGISTPKILLMALLAYVKIAAVIICSLCKKSFGKVNRKQKEIVIDINVPYFK